MTALGIRLNNPLNLTWRPQDKWQGLASPPNEGRFCSFMTPQDAFRAYTKELRSYIAHGRDTVPKFIRAWSETDQDSYIVNVLRWGHFAATQVLTAADALPLFKAMCRQEDGSDPYPDSVIQEGIDMATQNAAPAQASVSVHPTALVGASMGTAYAVTQLIVNAFHDFVHFDVSAANQALILIVIGTLINHFFPKGDRQ
jgi:hypothetical protein